MDTCDALIVGGGPAGAACAWRLRRAGLDVAILDRARFPRDKVCAGWVTPQVLTALELDAGEYARGRTLQPITGFRVGLIGHRRETVVRYDHPVSVGIRRCEFDHYLLDRSGARLYTGEAIESLVRRGEGWIVNGSIRASILVGAGGHFCPVARRLNPDEKPTAVVAAQEIEVPIEDVCAGNPVDADLVALYFSPDLSGYGWYFRKQDYVNVGFGQYEGECLRKAVDRFVAFLGDRGVVRRDAAWQWKGHAYRLSSNRRSTIVDDHVMLIGDAAGLAYRESGEGIRPAVESGLLAAATIIEANGRYDRDHLAPYERRLNDRFGASTATSALQELASRLSVSLAPRLLASRWLVRHILLDRWFLHAAQPALAAF